MSKLQKYYANIREKCRELAGQFPEECCLVTSAGTTCEVPVTVAGRLLVEGSHTLATELEAQTFREAQTAARARSVPASTLDEVKRLFAATMRERGNRVAQ
jgi:hypothetical protein